MKIFAPYPDERAMIILPNPEMGDVQRLESKVQVKRSMNGNVVVTHVKRLPNIRSFEYLFNMTRLKSLEFLNFYELFGAEKLRIEHDDASSLVGYIRVNPMELDIAKRALVDTSVEEVTLRFDFETIQ